MSAVIETLIPQQQFEVVLDRIGEILALEFEYQSLLGNYDLDAVSIFKERSVPCNASELPIVNVGLFQGEYSEETQMQTQGFYKYVIEVIANAQSEDPVSGNDGRGDRLSQLKVLRLLGIIRAILMDARYKTLGFSYPSIGHRGVERIWFMSPPTQDANTTRQGRLEMMVKVLETPASFVTPVELMEHFSYVTLEETENGFQWIYEKP